MPEIFWHISDQSLTLNVPENFRHIAMLYVMFSAYFSDPSVIKMCRKFSGTFVIFNCAGKFPAHFNAPCHKTLHISVILVTKMCRKFSGTFQLLYFPFTFVGHMLPTLSALLYFPLHFCRTQSYTCRKHVSYTSEVSV